MKQQSNRRLASSRISWNLSRIMIHVLIVLLGAATFIVIYTGPTRVYGGSISEAFNTSNDLANGLLVSIEQGEPKKVELANLNNNGYLAGVVEDEGASLLSFQSESENVSVATSGEASVIVSDLNGEIRAGDFIGTSWLSGVGMKANTEVDQKVLGVALASFTPDNDDEVISNISTSNGSTQAKIRRLPVRILAQEVGPASGDSAASEIVAFAQQLTGKNVAFLRIVVAIGLLGVSLLISTIFLVNAIRNSFISIGRNPLARDSIFLSLAQVSGVSVAIILIGTTLAYGLLVV